MGSGQSIAVQTRVAVCVKHTLGDTSSPVGQKPLKYWFLRLFTFLVGVSLIGLPIRSQEQRPDWQAEVRKCAEAQDWDSAMRVIDREIALAPQDMDVRAWRARVLSWSGRLTEAEKEYLEILKVSRNDPDNWMGLGGVYLREGKFEDALRALDRAVELDPKRADLRAARARALKGNGQRSGARLEFQKALTLDPTSVEARAGLTSLRGEPRHEVRFGQNNDLFNFGTANHDGWVSLVSRWTQHWTTSFAGSFYNRAGIRAEKFSSSVTGRLARWGALTIGGAAGHDNSSPSRRIGAITGRHGRAQRIFSERRRVAAFWNGRLVFPLATWKEKRLSGSLTFAAGTEDFAQFDQIGRFASQTYGGGLRYQINARQDITGYASFQKRTQDRTDTSFGLSYGIHF